MPQPGTLILGREVGEIRGDGRQRVGVVRLRPGDAKSAVAPDELRRRGAGGQMPVDELQVRGSRSRAALQRVEEA